MIREGSVDSLKEVLLTNHTLQRLGLEDNFLGDKAAKEFLQRMERNTDLKMTKLDLMQNHVSELTTGQINLFLKTHARELKKQRRASRRSTVRRESSESCRRSLSKDPAESRTSSRQSTKSPGRRSSLERAMLEGALDSVASQASLPRGDQGRTVSWEPRAR